MNTVYVDLEEHVQLERFLPLGFNRILIFFFSFPEMYSILRLALRNVSRNCSASVGDGCISVEVRGFSFKLGT